MTKREIVEKMFSYGWTLQKLNAKELILLPTDLRIPAKYYKGAV